MCKDPYITVEGGTPTFILYFMNGSRDSHKSFWSCLIFAFRGDSDFRIFSLNNSAAPLNQEVMCCVEIPRTSRDSMLWHSVLSVVTMPKVSPARANCQDTDQLSATNKYSAQAVVCKALYIMRWLFLTETVRAINWPSLNQNRKWSLTSQCNGNISADILILKGKSCEWPGQ